jgi:hypothetical protein
LPQDWAATQNSLAQTLHAQAAVATGPDRARLLAEAIRACQSSLEIYTASNFPSQHNDVAATLAGAEADLNEAQTADK